MKNVFKYLVDKGAIDAHLVDQMIVSAFLNINNIRVEHNHLIKDLIILPKSKYSSDLQKFISVINHDVTDFNFEKLIEIFEFVISPSDKIVNGAVYTPEKLRDYIVKKALDAYNGEIETLKTADISCGCGGFLLSVSEQIKTLTNLSYFDIYRDFIYGVDIAEYSVNRSRILLSLNAIWKGEDREAFEFNIFTGNSLIFDWRAESDAIAENGGFDVIVGNPPYVCSRNMDQQTLDQLTNWEVASSGHPDLYIPFFQIGIENLSQGGILGYITVNTFMKSINGRSLREYFQREEINLTLLNFGGEQVFRDRNTYTCICLISRGDPMVKYIRTTSNDIEQIDLNQIYRFYYEDLNHHDGWNLVNDRNTEDFINAVERVGLPFKDLYNTKNGIATLKNDVYKFRPIDEDEHFFFMADNSNIFPIEKEICRSIINANKIKSEEDIINNIEKIIFPYDTNTNIIREKEMKKRFPMAYKYLTNKKKILATRDKGKRKYEEWYAYGRRQSMDILANKLFFPHICDRPIFIICEIQDLLFYNGMAIVSEDLKKLKIIKKIMESDLFYRYISSTTKDYASGYISMSRNYLKNFGVFQFSESEEEDLLNSGNPDDLLKQFYNI
jgi:adenine-specific DNA-methyltransferase